MTDAAEPAGPPNPDDEEPTLRIHRDGYDEVFTLAFPYNGMENFADLVERIGALTNDAPLLAVQVKAGVSQGELIVILNLFRDDIRIGLHGEWSAGFHS